MIVARTTVSCHEGAEGIDVQLHSFTTAVGSLGG